MGCGITPVDEATADACVARWERFLADGGDVLKFVPASGAASRMFKALFAFVNGDEEIPADGSPVAQLVEEYPRFRILTENWQPLQRASCTTPLPTNSWPTAASKTSWAPIVLPRGT